MAETKPPRETPRARDAFERFCRLGPSRSLARLHQHLTTRQTEGQYSKVPTRYTLEDWSKKFSWQARAVAFDAEQELLRRHAFEAEAKRQESDNARLMHQIGQGCLGIAALILQSYSAPDGTLAKPAGLDDCARIIKAGIDTLRAASGQPSDVVALADVRQMQQRFEASDHETRAAVVAGLRALKRLQRGEGGDHEG